VADFPTPVRVLHNGEGIILLLADRGQISIGGHGGKAGSLRLADAANGGVIGLDADTGRISCGGSGKDGTLQLSNGSGVGAIGLNAATGQITIGGPGIAGHIQIEDDAGNPTLRLDGSTGDIILQNADCAEEFDCADADVEPGDIVVLNGSGAVSRSGRPFDQRVVGIVSGAGGYRPAIVLDRRRDDRGRVPVAITGKALCKVDATYAPVSIGDLLTTSATPGHAMRAADPLRAFGAVIGKALRPLNVGAALVPVLVTLR
jgi:hypothetical protein